MRLCLTNDTITLRCGADLPLAQTSSGLRAEGAKLHKDRRLGGSALPAVFSSRQTAESLKYETLRNLLSKPNKSEE
jgi:hypothetical protein